MSDFNNKVVIVTGAGGGIGRHHALEFARRGARVVVNDLGSGVHGDGSGQMADRVVEEIRAAGGTAVANYNSVADQEQAAGIVDQAVAEFGTVDILVNNAGTLRNRTLKNMPIEDFELIIQVHLMGTVYVTHAAWPIMHRNNYGRVVFTSSTSGIYGNFGHSAYGTAKMAMLGLMNVLALEGRDHNIHVNCIAPGADTRMTALDTERGIDPDHPRDTMHPRLIAPAALFLSNEDAPTGVTLHAMGGKFFRSETARNEGVELGTDATYEDLLEHRDELLDFSSTRLRELPG
jgi:NAD(P)-dependent dehydrogenase (short-subunit alcohol dehydrogenase family)